MKTKILNTEKGVFAAADGDQKIYSLAGNLVIGDGIADIVEQISKKIWFSASPSRLADLSSKLKTRARKDIFFVGKEAGKQRVLHHNPWNKRTNEVANYSSGSIDCRMENSPELHELAEANQFGFCTRDSKALYDPKLNLSFRPKEYESFFGGNTKRDLNDRIFGLFSEHLEQLAMLEKHKRKTKNRKDHERVQKYLKQINDQAIYLAHEYISLGYDLIDRLDWKLRLFTLDKKLQSQVDRAVNGDSAFSIFFGRKEKSLQEALRDYQANRKTAGIVVGVRRSDKRSVVQKLEDKFSRVHAFKHIDYVTVECPAQDLEKACRYLKKGEFEYRPRLSKYFTEVRPAHIVFMPEILSKPQIRKRKRDFLPNLEVIGSYKANEKTRGSGVKVAVIDTGIELNHDELEHAFGQNKGYDFIKGDHQPWDENGHGTHVAGIIAGKNIGVAPECSLYALRVLDEKGFGTEANVIYAIEWCIDNGIDIVNMSLGSPVYSRLEDEVTNIAVGHGIIVAAAAGNEGYGPSYPASYEQVISVAAVNNDKEHADFSNVWETTEISAPGVDVYSSYAGYTYAVLSGTSMATPHVSGVLALMRSISSNDIRKKMDDCAEELGRKDIFGYGLVRADYCVGDIGGLKNGRTKRSVYKR